MNTDQQVANTLATDILALGKSLAPDRFPKASTETVAAWGQVLAEYGVHHPENVWAAAVRYWASRTVGQRMVTPRDILTAARDVVARWETDPQRNEWLQQRRTARLRAREAAGQLPVGTAPESPGDDQPVAIEGRNSPGRQSARALAAAIGERAMLPAADESELTAQEKARLRARRDRREKRRATA